MNWQRKRHFFYRISRIGKEKEIFKIIPRASKMTTIDKQNKESLEEKISKLAETLAGIQERAVIEYTPLVNDICNRKATKDEVDNLLTWMFDFVGNEKMLVLFKKVCRTYLYTYPEVVGFYIMEYRKEYDRESLKGTKYEYLLEEDKELYEDL